MKSGEEPRRMEHQKTCLKPERKEGRVASGLQFAL